MPTASEIAVLREFERRQRTRGFDLNVLLSPWQKKVRASPAKRKALIAGRRSGKSDDIVKEFMDGARNGERNLYTTLTRANAKELIWDDLLALNEKYNLGGKPNGQTLRVSFRSRGFVALTGVNSEPEIAKARGKKWHRVAVDEVQSIPERILVPFLTEALRATLLDYGGELRCCGTRPAVRAGWWYDVISGKAKGKWELHQATIHDNPFLPSVLRGKSIEDVLREMREEEGLSEDDPTYRREILNEDVEDLGALLYAYSAATNALQALPLPMTYVFGIDVGSEDSDAVAVLGWSETDPNVYLVEEYVGPARQDVTDLANVIKPLRDKYNPVAMVIDEGGGGKKTADEIRNRHALPVEAADKPAKSGFIRLFNADLRKGLFKARTDGHFAADCKLVHKDRAALIHGELKEDKHHFHSDICDAVLYGWRRARHYTYREPVKDERTEEDKMQERLMKETEKADGMEWWEHV